MAFFYLIGDLHHVSISVYIYKYTHLMVPGNVVLEVRLSNYKGDFGVLGGDEIKILSEVKETGALY